MKHNPSAQVPAFLACLPLNSLPLRVAVLAALTTPLAHAASGTWNGTTDATWATDTNWSATPVPGSGDTATFDNAGNGNTTIDLGAGVTVGAVVIDTASATGYTIGTGASQSLALDNSGSITVDATVASNQVINGIISGTGLNLTHSGSGSLRLNAANTFTGDIVVDGGGTLTVGDNQFLGDFSNTITIGSGSTLNINGIGSVGDNYEAYDENTFIFEGGSTLANATGSVANNAFGDQLQFDGDVTITGNHRIDIFGDIDVTGTDITITFDFPDNTLAGGSVISGDMSSESIDLWLIKGGALFVNPSTELGDNADVRVEQGGTLRGNAAANQTSDMDNDVYMELDSELEVRNQTGAEFELNGTLTLEGRTDFVPDTKTIVLNSVLAGSGDIDFDSQGIIRLGTGFDDSTYTGSIRINNPGNAKFIDLANLDLGVAETTTLNADVIVGETGGNNFRFRVLGAEDTMTVAGVVSGGGGAGIRKDGPGTLILSGANTYTGATKLIAGTMSVTGSLTSTISSISSGTTLSVSGNLASNVTIPSGATLSGEGTLADVTLASGSTIDIASTGVDEFTVGTLVASGANVTVDTTSGTDIVVVNYTTYDDTNFASDFIPPVGGVLTNDTVNNRILLTFPPFRAPEARTWSGGDATNATHWDLATSENWAEGDMQFVPGDTVTFGDTGAGTVDIQNQVTPATATFSNTFGSDYTIDDLAPNVESISAETGGITVSGTGDVTLNVKVTGNTNITHSGSGTLNLGGGAVSNDFVGTITVDGGGTLRNLRSGTDNIDSLGDFGNTFTFTNGSTFDLNSITGNSDYQNYGTGSFVFGAGTTITNTSSNLSNDAFGDQLVFDGDVTLEGTQRFDISTIDVTGANIVITMENDTGNVITGDNSAESIASWVVNDGVLIASNDNALGSSATITINPDGALRGNIAQDGVRTIPNDIVLNGGQLESGFQNSDTDFTGTISVTADSSIAPNINDGDDREIHLKGTLTGSPNLVIDSGTTVITSTLDDSGFTGDYIIAKTFSRNTYFQLENTVEVTQDIVVSDVAGLMEVRLLTGNSATISGGITINDETPEAFDFNVENAADTLTISGNISGTGAAGVTKTSAGSLILSGVNTYTGNSFIYNGAVTLADGGRQTFYPTTDGMTNQITGSGGTLNADGEVYFDLSSANTTAGNSWQIIDGSSTTVSIGGTFSVNSSLGVFTDDGGTWTLDDGTNVWTFEQTTGTLSVTTPYLEWADSFGLTGDDALETANPDSDALNNLQEYAFGTDPSMSTGSVSVTGGVATPGAPAVWIDPADSKVYLRYSRRTDYASVVLGYIEEFSPDDLIFEDGNDVPDGSLTPVGTGTGPGSIAVEAVQVEFPGILSVSGRKARFGRLDVTHTP